MRAKWLHNWSSPWFDYSNISWQVQVPHYVVISILLFPILSANMIHKECYFYRVLEYRRCHEMSFRMQVFCMTKASVVKDTIKGTCVMILKLTVQEGTDAFLPRNELGLVCNWIRPNMKFRSSRMLVQWGNESGSYRWTFDLFPACCSCLLKYRGLWLDFMTGLVYECSNARVWSLEMAAAVSWNKGHFISESQTLSPCSSGIRRHKGKWSWA
jgi:hypothetical protein